MIFGRGNILPIIPDGGDGEEEQEEQKEEEEQKAGRYAADRNDPSRGEAKWSRTLPRCGIRHGPLRGPGGEGNGN